MDPMIRLDRYPVPPSPPRRGRARIAQSLGGKSFRRRTERRAQTQTAEQHTKTEAGVFHLLSDRSRHQPISFRVCLSREQKKLCAAISRATEPKPRCAQVCARNTYVCLCDSRPTDGPYDPNVVCGRYTRDRSPHIFFTGKYMPSPFLREIKTNNSVSITASVRFRPLDLPSNHVGDRQPSVGRSVVGMASKQPGK